ncbi:restriction endonuclease [Arthrobacter sp. CAN_A1]|uniref:restriction endonuclease n=1 Tax=Arthrobacter sp. CAN_A1 TaxID=2787717 RepID=UPI0018CAE17C
MRRISAEAYEALADALSKLFWFKAALQRYLNIAMRDHTELLIALPFDETKRIVSQELVQRLLRSENRYRELILSFMVEVSSWEEFPNLLLAKDRPELVPEAEAAVARLARVIKPWIAEETEAAKIQDRAKRQASARQLQEDERSRVESLKQEFLALGSAPNPQQRGRDFERLLVRLFDLYDFQPRFAYSVKSDQIDGSLSFDSNDYIVEAKWTKKPIEKGEGDIFAAKILRSGKNGLGLFVSNAGFSSGFKDTFSRSTPFITMDGTDMYAVLDSRCRLDDLLRAKKRHANETGSCFLPVSELHS